MKIAIAQINCTVGDLAGNAAKIAEYARRAKEQGASILLTPELSLCGYPPEDLLLRSGFYRACEAVLEDLARQVDGMAVIVGHPHESNGRHYNAASLLRGGRIEATYHKHSLPNQGVFDEKRYFESGMAACTFDMEGVRFAINICEDIWHLSAAQRALESGAQVLLVLNASPYHVDKQELRHEVARDLIEETGLSVIYANLVGGQDELIFDGGSFAMDVHGKLAHQCESLVETLALVELQNGGLLPGTIATMLNTEESIYRALCLGVRDYIEKNRFPGVLLGLSGGIDSALTLAVAVDALGADKVRAVMMPSPYTAQMSIDDSREMVRLLGVRYEELDILPAFNALQETLAPAFEGMPADTTEENLQARIRGTLLMALSNKTGSLVLTTGNKSEMTVGYCTLYGDMAGGFAVLKDVSKTCVYQLARYRNTLGRVIPERIITRPPSAELKPDQTDQDSLPPYDILDGIMECYVEKNLPVAEIVARGYAETDVRRVVRLVQINEYKRRQSPVGVRITPRAFGKDWRYPITVRYQDQF